MYSVDNYSLASATTCSTRSTPLPLTKENLNLINQNESEQASILLARYYNELPLPSPPSRRERRYSSNSTDTVMASPRLQPFPYHNDSLFLPTAERSASPAPSYYEIRRASCAAGFRQSSSMAIMPPRRQSSAPPRYQQKSSKLRRTVVPEEKQRSWFMRIWKLFTKRKQHSKKSNSNNNNNDIANTTCRPLSEKCPVWYSQFSANPPPPAGLASAAAA